MINLAPMGQTPGSAADALVGLLPPHLDVALLGAPTKRVQGDPRRPGGLPHNGALAERRWVRPGGRNKSSAARYR